MNQNLITFVLKRPHFVLSVLFALTILGIIGFFNIKQKLFPDADRPQIAVVVIEHGASAKDMADNVANPIERRLYTIDRVRRVFSTSKDEVAVITAEFDYDKDLGEAATDVANELSKIKSQLPKDIEDPQIYKISSATPPAIVLSVYPKDKSIDLADVRQIAENQIKNEILKLSSVANVDVFGGYQKEVFIEIDKDKLNEHNLSLPFVLYKIKETNADLPIGFIINQNGEFLLKSLNKATTLEQLKNIQITKDIKLSDIAKIKYDYYENNSLYYGNGKPAIALAVQRQPTGDTLRTIDEVKSIIPKLQKEFPELGFEITDSQEKIIRLSNLNMIEALRDAIIMTAIVIFFFLSNLRQMIIAGLSIPFVYGITIAIMWLLGMEFNIVTLTGIILALGMLVDDAVVVLENIERHLYELKEPTKEAVINGTKEVVFAVLSGTIATSVVLIPLLFVGDYPQYIFRPLAGTLLIAVIISFFVSITFIPLIAPYLLKKDNSKNKLESVVYRISEAIITPLKNLYVTAVSFVFKRKFLARPYFVFIIMMFIVSLKIILPTIGREIMPPMDTGIVKGDIVADSNLSIYQVEDIVKKISEMLKNDKRVEMVSIAVGSEPGVFTMGSGKTTQNISITIHYVDRFHRKEDIWSIERELSKKIREIPNIKYVSIYDYGATPLSTVRANLDVMVSGDDLKTLDKIANNIMEKTYQVKGIKSVSRSWDYDKITYNLKIDYALASFYGITPFDVASQLSTKIRGSVISFYNIPNEKSLNVRVVYNKENRDSLLDLDSYYITTPKGNIPLSAVAKIEKNIEPTVITREGLNYTVDILGYREKAAISHIMESFKEVMEKSKVKLPPGYEISQEGDVKEMMDSMGRMLKAIGIGIILLFFALVPPFRSFSAPIAVIFAVPLSVIGASWAILIMGYHQSMPGLMGIVLLAGIITKNSILLIDFINDALSKGKDIETAILDSIKIRTRPVLMTAFGTSVGMIPIALGWALGLERLAPLGAVAIGGLIIGTFLTLIYVPLLYYFFYKIKSKFGFAGG
ncbi:efflux RND transporter permease subunit [Venenivibrio stagnispumantis]|uniref:Multidrug efflux pump subunit AcrB n=1 Tax=Venenivibrio stagnispumantis TaxID=407998 RepID=A0AA46ADP3_9AQUI|nr:efflux RND transporter permease subunit [Venenivibrio stagnispumantis]MCW4573037.1 efflux RND transporter permease subunit [Venenivibrio stagnispumantis]SMP07441.1 Multidrug efflux pump subunit AcrB [Venenivibrio stagnispumantis]